MFETISRGDLAIGRMHLYLNNALGSNDRYYYRNLSIIWNDLTRGSRSRSHASRNIFVQSKHYLYIYSSTFVCLIFDVHLMIIKFYFQNIVFWQKVKFLYNNCGRIWISLKSIIVFTLRLFTFFIRHLFRMREIRKGEKDKKKGGCVFHLFFELYFEHVGMLKCVSFDW